MVISTKTLDFLTLLKINNNRDWFNEHKNLYLDAQTDIINFVEALSQHMGKFDESLLKLDPKKALFRIYRDTRFSKDKTPYKTNFGVSLGIGKGSAKAGYYLHIEPDKSFIASGLYMPESSILKDIRKEISLFSGDFLKVINDKQFKKIFPNLSNEDSLKKIPTGFEKDDPMAEFLKLKSYIVIHYLTDTELTSKDALENIAEIFEITKPFNDFFNSVILSRN